MVEVNGISTSTSAAEFDTANILHALEVIHNASTKNETRRQASDYLERLKSSQHAFEQGYLLGRDQNQQPLVRHFGLSLLEHVIRHEAHSFSNAQNEHLRSCVIELGKTLRDSDQAFIRNKAAELWIELAKRTWALDWYDMDQHLVELWPTGHVQKDFVLTVLENLSEDTFVREDTTAILRGRDLNSALVEIYTSSSNYAGGLKVGGVTHHMRYGGEGWLVRMTQYLEMYLREKSRSTMQKSTALKALAALRSAFLWIMSPSIATARCLPITCNCLTQPDSDLIIAAVDALITLYGRHKMEELEVQALVFPLCQAESTATLRQVYTWSVVGVDEIESPKYAISKKLSELVSLLCETIIRFPPPTQEVFDVSPFLHFIISIAEHESLIVSIPAMHSWAKLLETPSWRRASAVADCVAPLLNVVSKRLIQYDQLPDDTDEPAVIFVNDEIEIFPERQGFYLNYRKLCSQVIEWICYTHLEQAIGYVLTQVDEALDELERLQASFNPEQYQRISTQILQADAQFAIVDSAFKGLDRWQSAHRDPSAETEQLGQRVREQAKTWAMTMLSKRNFQDPQIKQRQLRTAVEISSRALQKDTSFAFTVLEHILASFISQKPAYSLYSEAVAELHGYGTNELRRLALQHADYFVTFYDQLQSKFSDIITHLAVDPKVQVDLKSILFLIVQRASAVDASQRQARLWSFMEPISEAWNSPQAQNLVSSLDAFAASQALDRVGSFMESIHAKQVEDWAAVKTPESGAAIQQAMNEGYLRLPLRETRVLLSISTEKLEQDSAMHKMICDLWAPMIGPILDCVLRLTSYNHQLHDPAWWPGVSSEYQVVIHRILRDRYWQSGISEGSMNEFHMKVKSSKASLEGFASSVRGRIRSNLEQCYSIIHTLGRLGSSFYNLPQVPETIAQALIDTTGPLSPHHFSTMLLMLPKLIEECPPDLRQHFLTPVLSSLLQQMDAKLTSEWEKLDQKKQTKHDEENLGDEMRDDSVLRQTTYKAVNMVSFWLDPRREEMLSTKKSIVNNAHNDLAAAASSSSSNTPRTHPQSMRLFVLSNLTILEPLLLFTTHALTYKDTKACQTTLATAQRIIPAYTATATTHTLLDDTAAASVREYISTSTLKAAITALHDGYYADIAPYYAQLIAAIWLAYGLPTHIPATESMPVHDRPALTSAPRDVLLSLPGMSAARVDEAGERLVREAGGGAGGAGVLPAGGAGAGAGGAPGVVGHAKGRKVRAVVLGLLEGVRGVRVSELGKIDTRAAQMRIVEKYKAREEAGMAGVVGADKAGRGDGDGGSGRDGNGEGVDLGGVADMFAGGEG